MGLYSIFHRFRDIAFQIYTFFPSFREYIGICPTEIEMHSVDDQTYQANGCSEDTVAEKLSADDV